MLMKGGLIGHLLHCLHNFSILLFLKYWNLWYYVSGLCNEQPPILYFRGGRPAWFSQKNDVCWGDKQFVWRQHPPCEWSRGNTWHKATPMIHSDIHDTFYSDFHDTLYSDFPDTFYSDFHDTLCSDFPDTFCSDFHDTFCSDFSDTFCLDFPDTFCLDYRICAII